MPFTYLGPRNSSINIYNVLDYGADPTGTVDSTVAINAAINAANSAGGGRVDIPNGTYLCDEVIGKSNIELVGHGWDTILKVPDAEGENGGHLVICTSLSNIIFTDLCFDGNSANQNEGGPENGTILLAIVECNNFHVTRCKFINNLYVAIKIQDLGAGPLSYNGWITDSFFQNTDGCISDQSHGTHDLNIISNRFDGGTSEGVSIYTIDGYYSSAINIVGNLVSDKTTGGGIQISRCKNFAITGNTVVNSATGIRLIYDESDPGMDPCEQGSVTGNTITGCIYGMDIYGKHVIVSGNMIMSPTQYGMVLGETCDDVQIASNLIVDVGDNSNSILVSGSTNNIIIQSNRLVETRAPSASTNDYGINLANSPVGTVIRDNIIDKMYQNGIYVATGVNTVIENNLGLTTDNTFIVNTGTGTIVRNNHDKSGSTGLWQDSAVLHIPLVNDFFTVPGTTNITSIHASKTSAGRMVTLQFADVLTFTDGGNLDINGDFVTKAGASITLYCDGTNWIELSRVTRP